MKAEGRYGWIWGELGKGVRGRYDQNLLHEILKKITKYYMKAD